LLDFQKNINDFEKREIQVIASSADTWAQALQAVERYKLTFRMGYGLNPREVSSQTGAFYNERENYLHATEFIIGSDGKIENAVYSSRSIGRLVAKDCLEFIGTAGMTGRRTEFMDRRSLMCELNHRKVLLLH